MNQTETKAVETLKYDRCTKLADKLRGYLPETVRALPSVSFDGIYVRMSFHQHRPILVKPADLDRGVEPNYYVVGSDQRSILEFSCLADALLWAYQPAGHPLWN